MYVYAENEYTERKGTTRVGLIYRQPEKLSTVLIDIAIT